MLLALVIVCFALSGFAALVYQTAWMRLFAIAFGTSEVSVVVVLAGYMAGLALGAAVTARFIDRVRRPVLVYGTLEAAIAVSALLVPVLVTLAGSLYIALIGDQPTPPAADQYGQAIYYSVVSFVILLLPTALMGATLPLLARYAVTNNAHLGARVSTLYAVNTAGAVLGTLAAGFWLLPALGLRGTVWIGVAVNGLVFLVAVLLARRAETVTSAESVRGPIARQLSPGGSALILPLIATSGVLSFVYEVLWTRMLSHVLGSSVYAFATMLSAFLTGIALGAAAAGLVARNPRRALGLFAVAQFGIALASAFVYSRIEGWAPESSGLAVFAFAVMLPSAMFIGATYPLAVRVHAGGVGDVGRSSAVVYAWNTVGCIFGAILAGFLIIPGLGFAGSAKFAVVANLTIGILALALLWHAREVPRRRRYATLAGCCVAAVFVASQFQPQRPDALITRATFGHSDAEVLDEVYYAVGRTSTVYLTENKFRFDLRSNGLPEAQIEFKGSTPKVLSQRWLGLWPSLARPDTDSLLVVGLGGGVVVEGVPPGVSTIHVVELEEEVIQANAQIGDRRSMDPISDERVTLVVNDARNALRLTGRYYDAVVSQPSHPWTSGASHLFTREFFALVKQRLADGGVFVQWMNAEFLHPDLLRQLAATLAAEFEYVRVYQPSSLALHFVASDSPIDIEASLATTGRPVIDEPEHFSRNGINGPADVIAALLLDEDGVRGLAGKMAAITDDDNRMAVDTNMSASGMGAELLAETTADYDPLRDARSWLRQGLADEDLAYVAMRLLLDGQSARVHGLVSSMPDGDGRTVLQAMLYRHVGRLADANELLQSVVPSSGMYQHAAFLRLVDHLPKVASGELSIDDIQSVGLGGTRFGAVLQGWRRLGQQDWRGVVELDDELSASYLSDLWLPYAVQLRSEWRIRANDPELRFAREALQLLDRTLPIYATPGVVSIRAEIGEQIGDEAIFVESTAEVLNMIEGRLEELNRAGLELGVEERDFMKRQLTDYGMRLSQVTSHAVRRRAEYARDRIPDLQDRVAAR